MAELVEETRAAAPRGILVVEDEVYARNALTRLLKRRGYEVTGTSSAKRAITAARRVQVGVVLMDSAPEDEIDGIEAAVRIQREQPLTSFIFVTAHAEDPGYRQRVQSSLIRLGGWVPKPFEIDELVELIDKEKRKLEILADLNGAAARGIDPAAYLLARADVDLNLPRGIVQELMGELQAERPESSSPRPPVGGHSEMSLAAVGVEIDNLYGQIRSLVLSRPDAPSRLEAVCPLRARLEELEELEADLLEDHYQTQLRFDAERAHKAEKKMHKLLDET